MLSFNMGFASYWTYLDPLDSAIHYCIVQLYDPMCEQKGDL